MDGIIQFGPFPKDQQLLVLSAWFDKCTEKADSPTEFEEAVGRLIDHIDCTGFEANFIARILYKEDSHFSNSPTCR